MISSSKRVIKFYDVNIDTENKVIIEVPKALSDDHYSDNVLQEPTGPDAEEQAKSVAGKIIFQAEQQAAEMLSEARTKASAEQEMIINIAKDEAEAIYSEARDSGYKQGMDAATSEGDAIIAASNQVMENANAWRRQMEETLEPDMVALILGITEKLLGDTVKIQPEVIINLIKQGLLSTTVSGEVKIYVSADDYDLVVSQKDELLALTDGSVVLDIVKDLSLNPMDSVISTPIGDVDVSLNQQYETLKTCINNILTNK